MGVSAAIIHRQGDQLRTVSATLESVSQRPGDRPMEQVCGNVECRDMAKALAGLGHPDRLLIMRAIASGAHSHADIEKSVKIKTGPLYHHLRTLERGGLVVIAGRNAYELSDCGIASLLLGTVACTARNGRDKSWRKKVVTLGRNSSYGKRNGRHKTARRPGASVSLG